MSVQHQEMVLFVHDIDPTRNVLLFRNHVLPHYAVRHKISNEKSTTVYFQSPKNTKTETEAKENHQEAGGGPQFRPGLSTGDVEV